MPGPWGRAIEAIRLSKRLNKETVAKRAKMTPTTYGRIERGQHTQTRKLQDIADVFGVPIEQVLQNSALQPDAFSLNNSLPQGERAHGQHRSLSSPDSASMHDLQNQITALQHQLASIVAEREAADRQRRERVSAARARKPIRARNARKPR